MNELSKMSPGELYDYLISNLDLKDHSLVFSIVELDDGEWHVIGAHYDNDDCDLYYDGYFIDACCWRTDDPEVEVCQLLTFMIGNGESDTVSGADVEWLQDALDKAPAFWPMLDQYADNLVKFNCSFYIDNPAYDPEEDEDE